MITETGSFDGMPKGRFSVSITVHRILFHTKARSWVIFHSGLEAWNQCPCVIDYTLEANEINRAWINSVVKESRYRGACSCVQRLYWHAFIQKDPLKRDWRLRLWRKSELCPLPLNGAASLARCNQGQCCSNQTLLIGSDKSGTYCWATAAKKSIFLTKTNKTGAV